MGCRQCVAQSHVAIFLFPLLICALFPFPPFSRLSCWDMNDNAAIWWVIKGPVLASIMVRAHKGTATLQTFAEGDFIFVNSPPPLNLLPQINFVLFIGIIVILVQKLQSPDIGGNESSIYL